jgi:hypothetical protein
MREITMLILLLAGTTLAVWISSRHVPYRHPVIHVSTKPCRIIGPKSTCIPHCDCSP